VNGDGEGGAGAVRIDPLDPHGPLRRSVHAVTGDPGSVLGVVLRRADVRALEMGPAMAPVHVAHEEAVVARAEATLRLVFQGYERDPRPMHEIGEVQRYARALDEESPAFLFFLERAQRAAFARCVLDGLDGEGAAGWSARKRAAVLGLGRAYGFDGARAWAAVAEDLAGGAGGADGEGG